MRIKAATRWAFVSVILVPAERPGAGAGGRKGPSIIMHMQILCAFHAAAECLAFLPANILMQSHFIEK